MRKMIKIIIFIIPVILVIALKLNADYELGEIQKEIAQSELEYKQFRETYINNNPNSPLSALFLFKLNKAEEGNQLLNRLISENMPEALYAKSVISLKGGYLKTSTGESSNILEQLCKTYIEPCIFLGSYYRKNNQNQLAIHYLKKVENTNEITALSELRLIYAKKSSKMYNEEMAKHYAKRMSQAIHHKTETRYHLTKHTTSNTHNRVAGGF